MELLNGKKDHIVQLGNMKNRILTFITYLFSIAVIFYSVPLIVADEWFSVLVLIFRLVLLLFWGAYISFLVYRLINSHRMRYAKLSFGIMGLVLVGLHMVESAYMFKTNTFDAFDTLTTDNWYHRYWGDANIYGFRGKEGKPLGNQKLVAVVGDSFVAGAGIEDYRDRFSDVLEKKLGSQFFVANLGMLGANTLEEFQVLRKSNIEPDVLIVSHFDNDIVPSVRRSFYRDLRKRSSAMYLIGILSRGSYFFGDIFACLLSDKLHRQYVEEDDNYVLQINDDELRKKHLFNVQRFIDFSQSKKIPIIFVVFPVLQYGMKLSYQVSTKKIEQFLVKKNVPVVSVYSLVKDMEYPDRMVNSHDSHPSIEVHRLVAQRLYEIFQESILK